MIFLSIVIVNWNSYSYLEQCLASVVKTFPEERYEVIVIDNASTDESVSRIKNRFPAVRLIANDTNAGFARANNQGFAVAQGKYVLILNPDTVVFPQAIERLTGFLDQHPDFAAVGPKLLNADKTIQFECARNFPTLSTEFFWLSTLVRRFPKNKIIGRYLMS
ncbi:MAG: glycosyltransferase family 2 protein, partial [Candidatus Omnitrophica bacterium]|nr:glycosyltransferase family 2 protein [Candidatus Omnitrophota bacterium]